MYFKVIFKHEYFINMDLLQKMNLDNPITKDESDYSYNVNNSMYIQYYNVNSSFFPAQYSITKSANKIKTLQEKKKKLNI